MSALRELQRRFAAQLLAGRDGLAGDLLPGRFGSARLLQVYRHNLQSSLTAALAAVYPVTRRLVGGDFFGQAARAYIDAHPASSGNLHDFGDRYPGFVAGYAPAAGLPYLPDVARLEWAWHRAFHAADHPPLDTARLAGMAPDDYGRLRFDLHPSARLLTSPYPLLRIWQVNQDDYAGDPAVDLDQGGGPLMVVRHGLSVVIEVLAAGDYALLAGLLAGGDLAGAAAAALAVQTDYDLSLGLARHAAAGTLVGCRLPGECPRPTVTEQQHGAQP